MSGSGSDYVSTQVGSDYVFAIAVPNDAAQMRKINEACLPENYPYMFWFNMVSTNPGRSFICRSVKERKVVGYALICEDTAGQLRLLSLAVLSGHRGHGVAAGLLIRGLAAAGSGRTCDLEVRVSNEGAIRLYERVGFRKIRIIPGYYADKEDAWLMTWSSGAAVDVSASPIQPPVA